MKRYYPQIFFSVMVVLLFSSCGIENRESETVPSTEPVTLYESSFLKGRISAITYSDKCGVDSTLFVYNENGHLVKAKSYSKGKEDGYCEYHYENPNSIRLHYYDNNHREVSYTVVEYDDNRNVTLFTEFGYIYPDTTKMVLLYMKHNSYGKDNRQDVAFEYYCDGIPPYKYRYTYNSDGTEVEECFLAVTGDIYTVTKKKRDNMGNVVEMSENMPADSPDWTRVVIEYKYDAKGNWVERKIIDADSEDYSNNYTKRNIYYLDE